MGLRQDKRSRDRQGAVSPPQESSPATSLRPTQGDETGGFSSERSLRHGRYGYVSKPGRSLTSEVAVAQPFPRPAAVLYMVFRTTLLSVEPSRDIHDR